jgi:hypothetical protein
VLYYFNMDGSAHKETPTTPDGILPPEGNETSQTDSELDKLRELRRQLEELEKKTAESIKTTTGGFYAFAEQVNLGLRVVEQDEEIDGETTTIRKGLLACKDGSQRRIVTRTTTHKDKDHPEQSGIDVIKDLSIEGPDGTLRFPGSETIEHSYLDETGKRREKRVSALYNRYDTSKVMIQESSPSQDANRTDPLSFAKKELGIIQEASITGAQKEQGDKASTAPAKKISTAHPTNPDLAKVRAELSSMPSVRTGGTPSSAASS